MVLHATNQTHPQAKLARMLCTVSTATTHLSAALHVGCSQQTTQHLLQTCITENKQRSQGAGEFLLSNLNSMG